MAQEFSKSVEGDRYYRESVQVKAWAEERPHAQEGQNVIGLYVEDISGRSMTSLSLTSARELCEALKEAIEFLEN